MAYINTFVEQRDAFSMNVMEVRIGLPKGRAWTAVRATRPTDDGLSHPREGHVCVSDKTPRHRPTSTGAGRDGVRVRVGREWVHRDQLPRHPLRRVGPGIIRVGSRGWTRRG